MSASLIPPLIDENVQTLNQLNQLLGSVSTQDYQRPLGAKATQTLGKHVRHIIEHYQTLLDACAASPESATFDYEQRQREAVLETQPSCAQSRVEALQAGLSALAAMPHNTPLTLSYPVETGVAISEMNNALPLPTTLGRELAFLTSHSIHHMALLGLLCAQLDIVLPTHFGVHPSTLRYWAQQRFAS
ncbi:hypothetical protein J7J47_04085 [Halomonas sp. ISL-60]|uniref:hypothetical protein n=1 Tax=Halomonas sp. ISL-56 TaxID=2819149 RepID=UPI001BE808DA|nr:hypothetical protein [Halomonas sp. ISL-56]MBT2771411.1 hypothetical protein [Halomonas sp. ISL-60]MBT2801524.1 hypothetical protein [Halomonas sp. ISL-56]